MNTEINIEIVGCDDTTEFKMTVNDRELAFLKELSMKSIDISMTGCQPIVILNNDWSYKHQVDKRSET